MPRDRRGPPTRPVPCERRARRGLGKAAIEIVNMAVDTGADAKAGEASDASGAGEHRAIPAAGLSVPDPRALAGAGGRYRRQARSCRGRAARRTAGQEAQPEAAPAVHLAQRPGPERRRCWMRSRTYRPRHPVLGRQLLHQGGAHRGLRLLAPGSDLLGAGARRHRHRLGRAVAEHARERLHAGRAGQPPPGRASRTPRPSRRATCSRAARRSRSRSTRPPRSISCCSRARCRCTTSS